MLTNIRAWGNSQGLCIPKDMLSAVGLNSKDQVELVVYNGNIVIRPYRPLDRKQQAAVNLKTMRRKVDDFDYREEMNRYLDERYMNE